MTEDTDNHKDVFAHFGLAAYHAQCLEMEIKNVFLLTVRANHKELPRSFFDGAEVTLDKQMLGTLVRDLKKVVTFGDSAAALLDEALANRNRLSHGFFERHATDLLSHTGRTGLIEEIEDYEQSFRYADAVCRSVSGALCKVLGITDEFLQGELTKMKEAAEQTDAQTGRREDCPPGSHTT